jgi:hypothetical protein
MKITKIVFDIDRSKTAVYLSDGTRLENVLSVEAHTSVEDAGLVQATVKVAMFGSNQIEVTDLSDDTRRFEKI